MSKDKEKDADEDGKSGGGGLKLIIFVVLALVAGAGGAYGAFAAGLFGNSEEGKRDNNPKYVYKGDADPYAPPSDDKDKGGMEVVHGEGGSEYRTAYFSFSEPFTSNLANSGAMIQVDIAASTHRDGRVLQWLKLHELAVRSSVLVALAATDASDLDAEGGKDRLQKRLTQAINATLEEKEGYGGVEAVHFKALLIQ